MKKHDNIRGTECSHSSVDGACGPRHHPPVTHCPTRWMYSCPNCDEPVGANDLTCPKCHADFGPESTWRPVAPAKQKKPAEPDPAEEEELGLGARAGSTLWLVGCAAWMGLLLPFGGKAGAFAAKVYLAAVIWEVLQLWLRGRRTTLFLILGSLALFAPMLALLSLLVFRR